ncbi:MAG: glycine/sarcosine/betaine reductase complex component C subunit alpha [Thermoanaerobacteraceae bacterium]|nr:glycine/sarcosine/betaine reductase complex component C subunit alpha [Thermoanaerobacteraceae bacterium]
MKDIEIIKKVINEAADFIETGRGRKKIKVGLTLLGSEHGPEVLLRGALDAAKDFEDIEISLIGPKLTEDFNTYEVYCESDAHDIMEKLLEEGKLDAVVTMHYNFPLGVATVGRLISPANGKEFLLSTTTGTSSSDRVTALTLNAIYGMAVSKSLGYINPAVGILNIDGARQAEKILRQLMDRGYTLNFGESVRKDGGCILRGNDVLTASTEVIVADTLTGNILNKIMSSFTSGGTYEVIGYGYGPGVGENFDKTVLILSRASGAPVVKNAIKYASDLVRGNFKMHVVEEMQKARAAGLFDILSSISSAKKEGIKEIEVPGKVVTEEIAGVDILVLEDAVKILKAHGIYAESGMGCTGPVILVAPDDEESAREILRNENYL